MSGDFGAGHKRDVLVLATGKVYAANGAARVLKVLVLTVAMASIVLGYRLALLLVTLYST